MDSNSPTGKLCNFVSSLSLNSVPENVRERAKYLILDGIGCALLGAHLPASEVASNVIFAMESSGPCTVVGWGPDHKISPQSAALINSTFIQGFELDDWHADAPLHSNAILIPALIAAAEHRTAKQGKQISGADFLLSMIVGYEVGPRVGLALQGRHILTQGWHSGAVFGPSASAAAVSRLYGLSPELIEDALGIACTQACGLMSAQFESDVKRMQHGFAARNGLLGACLAEGGYIGIKNVYTREYGGFLNQFTLGNGKSPTFAVEQLTEGLGKKWLLERVIIKQYGSMAATHATVDCIRALQEAHPTELAPSNLSKIESVLIKLQGASFHHGGWQAHRPLSATGAQMSNMYVAATQLVDNAVMPAQFKPAALSRDEVWSLVEKTVCQDDDTLPDGTQVVSITFKNGSVISHSLPNQKGIDPPFTNEEILAKWRLLAKDLINIERRKQIEDAVLGLDHVADAGDLFQLLVEPTPNPIA